MHTYSSHFNLPKLFRYGVRLVGKGLTSFRTDPPWRSDLGGASAQHSLEDVVDLVEAASRGEAIV